jgi:AraC-like DNA-binding protein
MDRTDSIQHKEWVGHREMAGRDIADSRLSTGEVAHLLGYSEPAAFHRAFERWTGLTAGLVTRMQ